MLSTDGTSALILIHGSRFGVEKASRLIEKLDPKCLGTQRPRPKKASASTLRKRDNRGTAYILYEEINDAERSLAKMHDVQLDGARIQVSIVLPRRCFSRSPPVLRRGGPHNRGYDSFRGGYDSFRGGRPGGGPPGAYRPPPIVIKKPDGEVVDFNMKNAFARATAHRTPAIVTTPTPPPRAPSAAGSGKHPEA
ncbi:hypothetical protein BDV95DRAFT_591433 [Massariosphaeria phaeospora]|uniref:RRM domain-containing protein n=1 Tax=Massariosphaeria phaeospora TaxID=100035 RepID=A0A7C8MDW6_9PLEO|nr:hypothetical protein BDV95DRAFT_591433 [Massariosphaeria phaeospora]